MKKPSFEVLRQSIGRLLGNLLLAEPSLAGPTQQKPLIVPVPNHWTHAWSRAAGTAKSLALAISDATHWPVNSRTVRRTRKTAKQGMLSWTERKRNVRGAFEIRSAKQLTARHVLLVDDVLTSGATAAELASRIKKAGASRVTVVVVARGTGARESPPPA